MRRAHVGQDRHRGALLGEVFCAATRLRAATMAACLIF
jgi:hypothetical protein